MSGFLSVGEVLWDIFPSGEHLGGAPFNFAANCTRLGHRALLLSAVGEDALGTRALQGVRSTGVSTEFVQRTRDAPTGTVDVSFDRDGQPHYIIQRPAAYDFVRLEPQTANEIAESRPDILYFGTLGQTCANNRDILAALVELAPRALRFYDVNLRKDSFSADLLRQLMPMADMIKFNEAETDVVQGLFDARHATIEGFCRAYSERFEWRAVCVTKGPEGCAILLNGEYVEVPGFPVETPSPVGAGDAFSAAFCHGIGERWPAGRIGEFANRVGAMVASRPEAVSDWTLADCYALTRKSAPGS